MRKFPVILNNLIECVIIGISQSILRLIRKTYLCD